MLITRASAICVIMLTASAAAQTRPAGFDIPTVVKQLAADQTHDQALAQLKDLPHSALTPLLFAAMDSDTPAVARRDIESNLPDIVSRLRTQFTQNQAALEKSWRQKN